jgi:two-component system CheB/CheR fusion protein
MSEPHALPRISICGIGASAGGVEALQQFFLAVAPDLGLAYVVIVHLAPDHKSELPAILSRCTTMPVVQVDDSRQEPLQRNHVYVIAPDRKLEITESAIGASPFDQPRGQRTVIDLFFRSLASTHGDGFAVLLSGSGSDGAIGARAVKEGGGLVLVQDPGEAMHGGMPRAAISTGAADLVLPVRELAVRLGELAGSRRRLQLVEHDPGTADVAAADDDRAL